MKKSPLSHYETVPSKTDHDLALNQLVSSNQPAHWLSASGLEKAVQFDRLGGSLIYFNWLEKELAPPTPGESCSILFSIPLGQYHLKGTILEVDPKQRRFAISASSELLRLQRRDNFRIRVPQAFALNFRVTHLLTGGIAILSGAPDISDAMKLSEVFRVVDLSVEGMAIFVDAPFRMSGAVSDHLWGELQIPGRESLDLHATVTRVLRTEASGAQTLGLKFLNLSTEDRQALMQLALRVHREFSK